MSLNSVNPLKRELLKGIFLILGSVFIHLLVWGDHDLSIISSARGIFLSCLCVHTHRCACVSKGRFCKMCELTHSIFCSINVILFLNLIFHCRLCARDPHHLFQRLESQVQEFVIEAKVRQLELLHREEQTPELAQIFLTGRI